MTKRSSRIWQPVAHLTTCAMAALAIACQPFGTNAPIPTQGGQAVQAPVPSLVIDAATEEAAKVRLSGKVVSDFTRTLVSDPTRWEGVQVPEELKGPAERQVLQTPALGDPLDPDWPVGGIDLKATPFTIGGSDRATNGFALRNATTLPRRLFIITKLGKFIDVDPDNPKVGYSITPLTGTFTKTYVTLSPEGSVAFVINDAGRVYAINIASTLPAGTHDYKTLNLTRPGGVAGIPPSQGVALFPDPLLGMSMASGTCTLHVVDNEGGAHRLNWASAKGSGSMTDAAFAASTLTEQPPISLTTATPLGGGAMRVKSPPVVLKNVLVIGDRAGNVIRHNYTTGQTFKTTVNYGWSIETPIAVDVNNSFDLTDMFVAAGAQMIWVKPTSTMPWTSAAAPGKPDTVYMGQYSLVEKGGNDALVHAANLNNYVNIVDNTAFDAVAGATDTRMKADTNYKAFSAAVGSVDTLTLSALPPAPTPAPVPPSNIDLRHLTHSGFLNGQPPVIEHFAGATGTSFYNYYPWTPSNLYTLPSMTGYTPAGTCNPVTDGTAVNAAKLLSPSAIEFDDDGSYFVADTNHCQVLYHPATTTSWQKWYPTTASGGYDGLADTGNRYNWLAAAKPNVSGKFYVFSGTLFPNAPNNDTEWSARDAANGHTAGLKRDVGNGSRHPSTAAGLDLGSVYVKPAIAGQAGFNNGVYARGTAVNRVQGLAIGNLGLYVANRNAFQNGGNDEGQILFIPKNGIPAGKYYGITNPEPGKVYVLWNEVDPQGLDVWRHPTDPKRDIIFAPSMHGTTAYGGPAASHCRVLKIDSLGNNPPTTPAFTIANLTMAGTTPTGATHTAPLNDPYDVGLDDVGNLFIADHGGDRLMMIANAVTAAEGATGSRSWGFTPTPTAGSLVQVLPVSGTNMMQEISSVTFALGDPQLPPGAACLYIGLGANPGTGTSPNRVIRMDQSRNHSVVAGIPYQSAPTPVRNVGIASTELVNPADGGDTLLGTNASVKLAMPWRARGRLNTATGDFETYICDRGNNRIRVLKSKPGTSQANGFLCFTIPTAARGKPFYFAELHMTANTATASPATPPEVALVSNKLKDPVTGLDSATVWNDTTVKTTPSAFKPTVAPGFDLITGTSVPLGTTAGRWTIAANSLYKWRLPAQAIYSHATNTDYHYLRLGIKTPVDGDFYWYPTSTGLTAPNVLSPDFYTNNKLDGSALATAVEKLRQPSVAYKYGTTSIKYPILSPPTIVYNGATRYVYTVNSNALWRYNVTNPTDFITNANGAEVTFTKTGLGRTLGTLYTPTSSFQFNSAPPLVNYSGKIFTLDVYGNSATNCTYGLSRMEGKLASTATNMYSAAKTIASTIPSTDQELDNGGIYITANTALTEGFFGLADGKIYRLALQ